MGGDWEVAEQKGSERTGEAVCHMFFHLPTPESPNPDCTRILLCPWRSNVGRKSSEDRIAESRSSTNRPLSWRADVVDDGILSLSRHMPTSDIAYPYHPQTYIHTYKSSQGDPHPSDLLLCIFI